LSGGARDLNPGLIFSKRANVQGISVGSMQTLETMNAAIAASKIKPVIDRVFGFDDVHAAYRHMEAGAHFGKIVVRVA
jgi:NADPH:quinone reductase-like Zn-dependent oxidoreductase